MTEELYLYPQYLVNLLSGPNFHRVHYKCASYKPSEIGYKLWINCSDPSMMLYSKSKVPTDVTWEIN